MNFTLRTQVNNILIPLTVSIAVSLLLFYMDEGYYNSKGFLINIGSWWLFITYVAALSVIQLLVSFTLTSITRTINVAALILLSGILLGLAVLFFLFSRF
jgi:hypothetical protein